MPLLIIVRLVSALFLVAGITDNLGSNKFHTLRIVSDIKLHQFRAAYGCYNSERSPES